MHLRDDVIRRCLDNVLRVLRRWLCVDDGVRRLLLYLGSVSNTTAVLAAVHNYVPVGALQCWTPWSAPTRIEQQIAVRKNGNGHCHNLGTNYGKHRIE